MHRSLHRWERLTGEAGFIVLLGVASDNSGEWIRLPPPSDEDLPHQTACMTVRHRREVNGQKYRKDRNSAVRLNDRQAERLVGSGCRGTLIVLSSETSPERNAFPLLGLWPRGGPYLYRILTHRNEIASSTTGEWLRQIKVERHGICLSERILAIVQMEGEER